MDAPTSAELAALRRAAYGPPPAGVDGTEHLREAADARARLIALDEAGREDDGPVTEGAPAHPRRRAPLLAAAGALLAAVVGGSAIGAWQLAHRPLEPLPGNEPSERTLALLGTDHVVTVLNWKGRSVMIGPSIDDPSVDCLLIVYGAASVGECGPTPTVRVHIDPETEGVSTQTAFEPVHFTWTRAGGLLVEYRDQSTAVPDPLLG